MSYPMHTHLFPVGCNDADVIKVELMDIIVSQQLEIFHHLESLDCIEPAGTAALTQVLTLIEGRLETQYQQSIMSCFVNSDHCQTSHISHIIVGNKLVEHSDVVGAAPVGIAPTTSSFSL